MVTLPASSGTTNPIRLTDPLRVLRDFLGARGKRVRPLYLCAGWYAVSGALLTAAALQAAVGVELFHTFALLHDDVIDLSGARHDRRTAQRQFTERGPRPHEARFGKSAAILLGDLCEAWSAELLGDAATIKPARTALDAMRCDRESAAHGDRARAVRYVRAVVGAHTSRPDRGRLPLVDPRRALHPSTGSRGRLSADAGPPPLPPIWYGRKSPLQS
ncbi:polyprenyl synthetase family protein [Streptomyces sp. NPDC047706]|uniref:polyprenyl synthetase family protein n=1 Tax=Streptomyces sp. NPDC047706 TaxID=3365486 RepID=UPI00371C5B19